MDANELGRWTRFAAKGGIGKCVAVQDCVAEEPGDLMFMKDDEIVVLMQLTAQDDAYLGYCEDVVGRFRGTDVRFIGRLKKPVMAKRSSRSLSRSSSRPSSSQGPATGRDSALGPAHADSMPSAPSRLSHSYSAATLSLHDTATSSPDVSALSSPLLPTSSLFPPPSPHIPSMLDESEHFRSASHSSSSTAIDSAPRTPADFSKDEQSDLVRIASLSRQVESPTELDIEEPMKSAMTVATIGHEPPIPEVHEPTPPSPELDSLQYGDDDLSHDSSFTEEPSPRFSRAFSDGDGETGIGLSLLQDFLGGEIDDADSVHSSTSGAATPEPFAPLDDARTESPVSTAEQHHPTPSIRSVALSDQPSIYSSSPKSTQLVLAPEGLTSAPPSPREVLSRSSGHPSVTDSEYNTEEWEGASDIYDNYRYSRYSVASRGSRLSRGSMHTTASNFGLEAPPPVPFDGRRPSVDSVRPNFGHGRDRMGSTATTSSSVEDVRRLITSEASSTSVSSSQREPGTPEGKRVPPPLELSQSSHAQQLSTPPGSDQSPSPLLHARFNSPLSSPEVTSSTGFSPLSPPLFSNVPGGAASALRQRLEQGRGSRPGSPADTTLLADSRAAGKTRLSTQPIVVDDEDESNVAVDRHTPSSPPSSQPTSPSYISEKKRMLETTYIVANQAPPPPYTPMSPTPDAEVEPQPGSSQPQPQPQPPTRLAPAGQHVPRPRNSDASPQNEFLRRSLFAPHPHAPKPVVSPTGPTGPMYGRSPTAGQFPPSTGPPPGSVLHTIHMALASQSDPYRGRRVTIYARFDRELAGSIGPVPISFTLEPPNNVPANKKRMMTAPPQGLPRQPEPAASESNAVAEGPTPQASFFPSAPKPRPRSRSFSGLGATTAEIFVPESESTSDGGTIAHSKSLNALSRRSKSSSPSPSSSPSVLPVPSPVPLPSAGPAASSSSARPLHKPSPLSLSQNNIVASPTSSFSPPSPKSPVPRSPVLTASPISPVTSHMSLGQASVALSPPTESSPLPSNDASSSEVTRSFSGSSDHHSSTPPLTYRPRHVLRHSRSSVLSSGQNGARETSPARSSIQDRPSVDSLRSAQSDVRSVTSPVSVTHSLKSKLSLPALKIRGSDRSAHSDERSPTLSMKSLSPSETHPDTPKVQIKDVDFELVKPAVPQLSVINEDSASSTLPSPIRIDATSLRASSPAFSTFSGISARTAPPLSKLDAPPRVVSEIALPAQQDVEAHRQRELRWISMISSVPAAQARKNKKVRKLLWEGVPASVRYLVWAHLTDSKAKRIDGVYYKLTQRERVPASSNIERDMRRVFPNEPQLHDGSLLNTLQAYLTMVPDLHYSRGLTVIAGHLLLQSPEEDAFWTFVSLMDTHLRMYFSASPAQMEVDAQLFGKAVESNDSALAKKVFVEMDIPPASLCRPWFSALFLEALPLEHSQRVWDIFLFEGVPFLFRVGLAIMLRCKTQVMQSSSRDSILNLLLHPPSEMLPSTADAFLELTTAVKLKDEDVRKQRVKLFDAQMKRQAQSRTLPSQTGSTTSSSSPLSISLPRQ